MTRCIALTKLGKRCKRGCLKNEEYCFNHIERYCNICVNLLTPGTALYLKNCNHFFCKECISDCIYKNQWYEEFSTDSPLLCPGCKVELCDTDWQIVTDYLVNKRIVRRNVVYNVLLNPVFFNKYHEKLELNSFYYWVTENNTKMSDCMKKLVLNREVTVLNSGRKVNFTLLLKEAQLKRVFFPVYDETKTTEQVNFYVFKINYLLIRINFAENKRLIAEYVFKPDRLLRMGEMNKLYCLDYIDYL
jgi:hypothetical protein